MTAADEMPRPRVARSAGEVQALTNLLADENRLSVDERQTVAAQALVLMEQLYVHLPLKRAMHAAEPIQRLKLLQRRLAGRPERWFDDEMRAIFTELRDLHTSYGLSAPFHGKVAYLPFRIEEFFADGERSYVVSEVALKHPYLERGSILTHWNGVPIERAVELNAARHAGSNWDARHARGLATLTVRPLEYSAAPDEESVVVAFRHGDDQHEALFRWALYEPPAAPFAVDPDDHGNPLARTLGTDVQVEIVRRTYKSLFAPEAMRLERRMASLNATARRQEARLDLTEVSTMPDVLQYCSVSTKHGEFGYIRIRSFMVEPEPFVAEVVRILDLLPEQGVILDVRGNGGGVILAGERLLQLFTPRTVEPERLHFVNTPLTLRLCSAIPELGTWAESIAEAGETGTVFSDGFPVLPDEAAACNRIRQRYFGPVVLITDALCYSTTDIFAAGFQDHAIGPILGTDKNTGAGGANVWTHGLLMQLISGEDSPIRPLPKGTSFRVAIRRTTRVGSRSGDALEDLGVVPDEIHLMTLDDVLLGNPDLIDHAAKMLANLPVRVLTADVGPAPQGRVAIAARTRGITRIDAYVDGRPRATVDVSSDRVEFDVPLGLGASDAIELMGFDDAELVAVRRMPL